MRSHTAAVGWTPKTKRIMESVLQFVGLAGLPITIEMFRRLGCAPSVLTQPKYS
jgi:hypothetical protein